MAYSTPFVQLLISWKDKHLRPGMRILDLGAQQFDPGVPDDLVQAFVESYNPGGSGQLDAGPYAVQFVAQAWKAAGFEYRSIDMYPAPDSLHLDLNKDELPAEWIGQFDVVFNMGTTEHVANQMQAFKVVHDALKVGGFAFHNCPFAGYMNHGLIKYEPIFFLFLAAANCYELAEMRLPPPHDYCVCPAFAADHSVPDWSQVEPSVRFPGSQHWLKPGPGDGLVEISLRKTRIDPYRVPMDLDTMYAPEQYPYLAENQRLCELIEDRHRMFQIRPQQRLHLYFDELVTGWTSAQRRIVIYSAGEHARLLLENTSLAEALIVGISDRDPSKWGQHLCGFMIYPPDQIPQLKPDIVLIASVRFEQEIREQLGYLQAKGVELVFAHPSNGNA